MAMIIIIPPKAMPKLERVLHAGLLIERLVIVNTNSALTFLSIFQCTYAESRTIIIPINNPIRDCT